MVKEDKRVDDYIMKAADFAQPIMNHLREVVRTICPETQETIKWGFPHFMYKDEILCSMAAFKHHCAFLVWKAALLEQEDSSLQITNRTSMGHLGKITSMKELPADKELKKHLKAVMKLNEAGIKVPKKAKATDTKTIAVPQFFEDALKKNKKAMDAFSLFSPSCKKEYIEWLTEAKTEQTRNKRLITAMEWIAEGKDRNWQYKKK